jgi:hypothetical protein
LYPGGAGGKIRGLEIGLCGAVAVIVVVVAMVEVVVVVVKDLDDVAPMPEVPKSFGLERL